MSSLDELARTPAVDLFVRRAQAANRTFALTSENAAEIAEIAISIGRSAIRDRAGRDAH